jgi:hypothetical protein
MTALAADRDIPRRDGLDFSFPLAASTLIYAGALVVLNSDGNATKGTAATGLVAVGVSQELVDNSAGSAGGKSVKVRRGVFRFANSAAGDAIARANIGSTCYIVDDQTVALTNGTNTRSAAGKIRDVDADGVWVEVGA